MIFNSFKFLVIFLPLTLILFFMPGLRRLRHVVLIGASLVFYLFAGIEHVSVLLCDIAWVYAIVSLPGYRRSRLLPWLAALLPAAALIYFKYATFLVGSLLALAGAGQGSAGDDFKLFMNVALPAGISFFTFQIVALAVDIWTARIERPRFRDFLLYITFFPHLVAGPILRYEEVAQALERLTQARPDRDAWAKAVGYVCVGLALKVLLADTLGHHIEPYRSAPGALSVLSAAFVIFAYSFQLYFDFYGYSMVAIGLAVLFGFHFPPNFDRPYLSRSPKEFWRRWHMTLSFWIRDYVYVPLGGNRNYLRNIIIVMAICGLWHGAGWNFVVWGLLHAALVVFYHLTRPAWDRLPAGVQVATTFILVSLAWTLFLFDFQSAHALMRSLAGLGSATLADPPVEAWGFMALAAVGAFAIRMERIADNRFRSPALALGANLGFAGLLVAVLLFLDRSQTFIYFRF